MVRREDGGGKQSQKPSGCNFRQENHPLLFIFSHTEKPRGKWLWSRNKRNTTRGPQHVFRPYNVDASPGSPRLVEMISRFSSPQFYLVLLAIWAVGFWATHNHNGRWTHNEREYYCKLIKESFSFFFNESRGHDSAITPTHTTLTEYLSRHWQLVDPKAWGKGGWVGISIRISLHVAVLSAI